MRCTRAPVVRRGPARCWGHPTPLAEPAAVTGHGATCVAAFWPGSVWHIRGLGCECRSCPLWLCHLFLGPVLGRVPEKWRQTPSATTQRSSRGCALPVPQPVLAFPFQQWLKVQQDSQHHQESYISSQGRLLLVMKENRSVG